jgi:hypothetical protein
MAGAMGWSSIALRFFRDFLTMSHPIHRVVRFEIVAPFTLRIHFEDEAVESTNFHTILAGDLYGPLNDLRMFNRVHVDPEVHALVWPNGADFDPATLDDGPRYEQEPIERAKRWQTIQV